GSSLIAERILSLLDARQPAAPSVESVIDALVQAGVGRIRSVDQPESLIASEAVWPAELPLSSRWTKAAPRESVIVHIRRMLGQYPAGSVMMLRRDAAEIRLLNFAASVKRGGPFNDPSRLIERLKQVYDPTTA